MTTDKTKQTVVWEDPPPKMRGPGQRGRRFDDLVEHPGKWARIPERFKFPTAATSIKARAEKVHGGVWEATGRKKPDGTHAVYLRYIGAE